MVLLGVLDKKFSDFSFFEDEDLDDRSESRKLLVYYLVSDLESNRIVDADQ